MYSVLQRSCYMQHTHISVAFRISGFREAYQWFLSSFSIYSLHWLFLCTHFTPDTTTFNKCIELALFAKSRKYSHFYPSDSNIRLSVWADTITRTEGARTRGLFVSIDENQRKIVNVYRQTRTHTQRMTSKQRKRKSVVCINCCCTVYLSFPV